MGGGAIKDDLPMAFAFRPDDNANSVGDDDDADVQVSGDDIRRPAHPRFELVSFLLKIAGNNTETSTDKERSVSRMIHRSGERSDLSALLCYFFPKHPPPPLQSLAILSTTAEQSELVLNNGTY